MSITEGITRISVKGYKSIIEERSIEVRPLTILAGANSSGKSSIMQPILMLKQTLDAISDPGALLINGPYIQFTLVEQFLSRNKDNTANDFQVGIEVNGNFLMKETFQKSPRMGVDITEMRYYRNNKILFVLYPQMAENEIIQLFPKDKIFEVMMKDTNWKFKIERKRFFLKAMAYSGDEKGPKATFDPGPSMEIFSDNIQKIIHVPATRGNPERNYQTLGIGPLFPGSFGNYVASIINHWKSTNDQRLDMLGKDLELLGLTWKVDVKQIDDTSIEILVGRLQHKMENNLKDLVSIADVGFGVSQTLPALVALLLAEPGQVVYIEQPEIHIHPKAQVAMAQILANAANRGVRVIIETHSSLLLLGIQSIVAEGKLSPDKVKLHWFKRRPNDGVTDVHSADLDKAGAFGDWPEDFGNVQLETDIRYIHAAESRLEE